jgi:hypothetical protein
MGIDPRVIAGDIGERMAEDEDVDLAQRRELARRLEAAIAKLDAIRDELEDLVYPIERGP